MDQTAGRTVGLPAVHRDRDPVVVDHCERLGHRASVREEKERSRRTARQGAERVGDRACAADSTRRRGPGGYSPEHGRADSGGTGDPCGSGCPLRAGDRHRAHGGVVARDRDLRVDRGSDRTGRRREVQGHEPERQEEVVDRLQGGDGRPGSSLRVRGHRRTVQGRSLGVHVRAHPRRLPGHGDVVRPAGPHRARGPGSRRAASPTAPPTTGPGWNTPSSSWLRPRSRRAPEPAPPGPRSGPGVGVCYRGVFAPANPSLLRTVRRARRKGAPHVDSPSRTSLSRLLEAFLRRGCAAQIE